MAKILGCYRFGTTPGSQGTGATKKADELKRKARVERFGIKEATSTEDEEKKKARLSRFGSAVFRFGIKEATSTEDEEKKKARLSRFGSASAVADPLEEQKKQARALRFQGHKLMAVENWNHRRQQLLARLVEKLESLLHFIFTVRGFKSFDPKQPFC
ncbi:hypothetical protein LXL04_008644 [Taraxacum kok-saghyz]